MSIPTYEDTIERYRKEFLLKLERREISPFVIPADIVNYVLLVAYLMTMRKPSHTSKILFLVAVVTLSVHTLQTSRTLGLAYGTLIGISSSWCIALSTNLLFFSQPAESLKRRVAWSAPLERDIGSKSRLSNQELWQGMPKSAYKRLFWILDLLGSLRALHWSHGQFRTRSSSTTCLQRRQYPSSVQGNLAKLLLLFLCVDCLKEIIARDSYFWGFTESDPPDYIKPYLPDVICVKTYRMLVAFAVLYIAIELISASGNFFFVNILGPSHAGTWGNEWAYRSQFDDFDAICTRGLQGWWGSWWHQMFRSTLTSPANAIVSALDIQRQHLLARAIKIIVPFLVSGAIHATGSYTMWGDTRPINSFLFFALQPAGIGLQIVGTWTLYWLTLMPRIPWHVRKATNLAFTVIWLLSTFPLLADDFARGGLWLTEPFPISVLQMVGLGSPTRYHQVGLDYGPRSYTERRWWYVGLTL